MRCYVRKVDDCRGYECPWVDVCMTRASLQLSQAVGEGKIRVERNGRGGVRLSRKDVRKAFLADRE